MEVDALLLHDRPQAVKVARFDRLPYGIQPTGQQGESLAKVRTGPHPAVTLER